jgi:NADPH-dependent curcumin reductase CurA
MGDHFSAIRLENAARRALGLDGRGGMAGVIDADFIDYGKGAFTVICAALAPYYKGANPEQVQMINAFIDKHYELKGVPDNYDELVKKAAEELNQLLDKLNVRRPS